MRILHLIDTLDSSACGRQMQLLGGALGDAVEVCCLGPDTAWAQSLRDAGVAVHALQWTRWIDPGVVWKLHQILRDTRPDVVHVWRLSALRMLALAAHTWLPRVVLSGPLPAGAELAWWDRWLLRQVRCVEVPPAVPDTESLSPRCKTLSAGGEGEAPAEPVKPGSAGASPSQLAGLTADTIVCVSPLERVFGVRNAIWAFDIVHCLFPEARLQISGAGSQELNLRNLAKGLQNGAVHFVGAQGDLTPSLRIADVVWIPSVANCGGQIALDALALGRAVIASDVPCLRELIDDGATGFLVPPGDVVALARRTRLLLTDHTLRERLGDAARRSVRQRFPLAAAVERMREVYRLVAA